MEETSVWTWWPNNEVGHNQEATKTLSDIMGEGDSFTSPKPVRLIKRVLQIGSDEDSLILDSFAGSGTTAQAVLELNKEDGGNRKFVLVQQKYDSKDDEKKKLNLCQTITAERVRRVIAGKGVPATGGGFTYARVSDRPLFGEYRDLGETPPPYEDLAKYIFYTETSRQWDPAGMDKAAGRIGAFGGTSYFLLYTPDGEANAALDLKWLKSIAAADPNKRLVVYCEKFWMHRDELRRWEADNHKSVRTMIVPFQLK
ncbi:MAG: DNA methyltransferase [Janthinobacterium lividum]